jgi:hypothetical protein
MRVVIALASIPAVIWVATPSSAPPIVAKVVATESIRERRQDEATFALRWRPVADMPPTIETRIEPILLVSHETAPTSTSAPATPSARRLTSRVSLRTDVCARHGQRKVMVGKYRWRCRR